jgi:hypothetical protein
LTVTPGKAQTNVYDWGEKFRSVGIAVKTSGKSIETRSVDLCKLNQTKSVKANHPNFITFYFKLATGSV